MNFFIKHNHSVHQQHLMAEAQGLYVLQQWIDKTQTKIKLPKTIEVNEQQITLAKINSSNPTLSLQKHLGQQLAKLHSAQNTYCGLEADNFIGLNPQKNGVSNNWGEFFYTNRLQFQVGLIKDSKIRNAFNQILKQGKEKLIDWLNQHCSHFSILHGDLWSGNVMFDHDNVWLIDPAVYFGDSEADMAMTEMFGGFSSAFYQSYQSVKPLSEVYPTKRTIYNLYHYLNHYNLFGSGYLSACRQAFGLINQDLA